MSVPLDRLYHYLGDCVNHDLIIYRWAPHGSRKLEDLSPLTKDLEQDWYNRPMMLFHDQEPLFYNMYTTDQLRNRAKQIFGADCHNKKFNCMLKDTVLDYVASQYLRAVMYCGNCYDKAILVHSEVHSSQVELFAQKNFVPVYYWSHAVISLDWFRYAAHDLTLAFNPKKIQQDFLIYNRAWSGTREYRLCFVEQLLTVGLQQHCNISFSPEDGEHYSTHQFTNPDFQIVNHNLHNKLELNTHNSTDSADYCSEDYATAGIEVVLETLFDDRRWHLTEKTLRPIACGKPFILMATQGSLKYLQTYGFETFDGLIDESYDTIVDSRPRLDAIIQEMKRIAELDADAKQVLYTKLHEIAQRNKQRFFNGLFDQVIEEYKINLNQAMIVMQQHCTNKHYTVIQELLQN